MRGGEGRRRESRGVTDSLTVSPCIGNERECGGRQLQAVTRHTLLLSALMSGLKNVYSLFCVFISIQKHFSCVSASSTARCHIEFHICVHVCVCVRVRAAEMSILIPRLDGPNRLLMFLCKHPVAPPGDLGSMST